MRSFSKVLSTLVLTIILSLLIIFLLFPKYLFLEELLQRKGIFILSRGVKEGLNSVVFGKGRVFFRNEELAKFGKLELRITPFGIKVKLLCKGRVSELLFSFFGNIEAHIRDFVCSSKVKRLRAELKISEGVYGNLYAEKISGKGTVINKVSLSFRGDVFTGSLNYLGMELRGRGRVKLNKKNLLKSYVSALFKGKGVSLEVLGTLSNPSVRLR